MPATVEMQWSGQFKRFAEHYNLGGHEAVQPEYVGILAISSNPFPASLAWPALGRAIPKAKGMTPQDALALQDLEFARINALVWFSSGSRQVPSKLPGVDEKLRETTAQRIAAYKNKLQQLTEIVRKFASGIERIGRQPLMH